MTGTRKLVSSGSDFEATVGYSRAVRVGPYVAIAGTTGAGPADDIVAQAQDALRRIEIALHEAGASLTDVVRTRIYVTDISGGARSPRCMRGCSGRYGRWRPWSKSRR